MADSPPVHLDAETCRQNAAESRQWAEREHDPQNRALLLHMAETWEQIAKNYENGRAGPP